MSAAQSLDDLAARTGGQRRTGFVGIRGAREHNLANIDVDIPRDQLVAVIGPSGSGKTSLAFGTLYAEANLRYLETINPYVRRLLRRLAKPAVDNISGLPPAIALEQPRTVASSASTVGSVSTVSTALRLLFSRCGRYADGAQQLEAEAFSVRSEAGACATCAGQGFRHHITEASLVPRPELSIRDGAISAWPGAWHGKNLRDILQTLGFDIDRPWAQLPQSERDWILFTDERPVVTVTPVRGPHTVQGPYQGTYISAREYVLRTLARSRSEPLRQRALQHTSVVTCPSCAGRRLNTAALAVTVLGRTIDQWTAVPLATLAERLGELQSVSAQLESRYRAAAQQAIVTEIADRVAVLGDLGLGHLELDRPTTTLSTGELQRLRIASIVHTGLFGVVYVLDEPSAGLHPSDRENVVKTLVRLRDSGNSVVLVEHDMAIVRACDWIVEVGPGAGIRGGTVVYSGPTAEIQHSANSPSRRHLYPDQRNTPMRELRHVTDLVTFAGLTMHNLRGLTVQIPRGALTSVTGVSGSGKSSLLKCICAQLSDRAAKVVAIDRQPIGRTPRSNVATYSGLLDPIRKAFAAAAVANDLTLTPSHFSFNRPEGRCARCKGDGVLQLDLVFLPDTYAPCDACDGRRFKDEVLEVTLKGLNISEILALTVASALEVLESIPGCRRILEVLCQVGLDYLPLGQAAPMLSGGEAQRLRIAAELRATPLRETFYVLDEPTAGLHPDDVDVLIGVLHRLVGENRTVVVAEHNMTVVAQSDWVLDLGPGGGADGGRVVASGRPQAIACASDSLTGHYLGSVLR